MPTTGDQDAGQAHAGLTVEQGRHLHQGGNGRSEREIVQNDGGRLPAKLKRHARDSLHAARGDVLAGRGGAGEAHLVDARVANEVLADRPIGRQD